MCLRCPCISLFSLRSFSFIIFCELVPITPVYGTEPPTQPDVRCGHISLLSGVLCHPVVSDPRFKSLPKLASSLLLIPAHNSLCGRTNQSGPRHSCSVLIYHLSPLSSRTGSLPLRGAERDITAPQKKKGESQIPRCKVKPISGLRLKRLLAYQDAVDYHIFALYLKLCACILLNSDVVK